MRNSCRWAVLLLGLLATADSTPAQPAVPPPGPAPADPRGVPLLNVGRAADRPLYRSGVDLVALEVCVKGRDGRLIDDLDRDDFLIFEDGKAQPLLLFVPGGHAPLAVALVLDRSSSMAGERLAHAKAAALAFLDTLNPDDLVEVITFNERADRTAPLSADRLAAAEAISGVVAQGGTGLFEAIAVGIRDLRRPAAPPGLDYRRALVVLSDGEDTSSRLAFEDLLDDARRSGVLIYAISLRTDEKGRWLAAPYHLAGLALDTGGRVVSVQDLGNLTLVYEEIAAELRHLYRLGYVPRPVTRAGVWRTLAVQVRNRDARVRTRAGYYLPGSPSAPPRGGR